MSTKEKIQLELEKLSEQDLEKVSQFINELKNKKGKRTQHLKTFNLGGKFDNIDIRKEAYE